MVLEVVANLIPNPSARTLLVLGYPDVYHAGDDVPEIMSSPADRPRGDRRSPRGRHEEDGNPHEAPRPAAGGRRLAAGGIRRHVAGGVGRARAPADGGAVGPSARAVDEALRQTQRGRGAVEDPRVGARRHGPRLAGPPDLAGLGGLRGAAGAGRASICASCAGCSTSTATPATSTGTSARAASTPGSTSISSPPRGSAATARS